MELLQIEERFLRDSAVSNALALSEIKAIQRQMTNGQKKRFEQSLQLSKIAVKAFEWFKSEAGKAKMSEEGISWTAEDFAGKVFGFKKSFFYKLIKAGQLEDQVIEEYRSQNADSQTIEELLKFARQGGQSSEGEGGQGGEGEGGQGGEGEGEGSEGGQSQPTAEVMAQLSFKSEGLKFNIKLMSDHSVKVTGADNAQIKAMLRAMIDYLYYL